MGYAEFPILVLMALATLMPFAYAVPALLTPVFAGLPHDVYLAVSINGMPTELIVHFQEIRGKLSTTLKDLDDLGVLTTALSPHNSNAVALDSLPESTYHYDSARQTVDLRLPDRLRKPYVVQANNETLPTQATTERGLLFNYDLYAQSTMDAPLAAWSEQRYFDAYGVLSNTGNAYFYRGGAGNDYVRFDTNWRHADPNTLRSWQVGDTVSSSLSWSRAVRLGGVQWQSDFSLRPDLVTFPLPTFGSSAVVPSAVDLYVNSVQQFSGKVPSGPFVLNTAPGSVGGGVATVVTRDALGRSVSVSVPFYIDSRLLRTDFDSYSLESGWLRNNYGQDSFSYEPTPVLSGTLRHGVNDSVTLEAHSEGGGGLMNGGIGVLWRAGTLGVFNASFAGSAGAWNGQQVGVGFQRVEPRVALDVQLLRSTPNYGDLAASSGAPVPQRNDRMTVSFPFSNRQSVSLSYIASDTVQGGASRIGSLSYTLGVGDRTTLNVNAYQDVYDASTRGLFVSLGMSFENRVSVNTSVSRQDGATSLNTSASRAPDYGGGWGWAASAGEMNSLPFQQAQAQYLGHAGQLTALMQNIGSDTVGSLDASGAIVWMDGVLRPARQITDSFALVSTDGVAHIPVLDENRKIGETDGSGHFLIPDISAYQHNSVAIDALGLPADMQIATTKLDVVPQARSGAFAHFPMNRYAAASVLLHLPDGTEVPAGAHVSLMESKKKTVVGYDGLAFIDGLKAENHLQVTTDTLRCRVQFTYTPPQTMACQPWVRLCVNLARSEVHEEDMDADAICVVLHADECVCLGQ